MQLVRFLMKLSNERVTIEVKDGSTVSGTIVGVDNTMNVTLKDANSVKGINTEYFDQTTIRGSTIRYVQLPETLNMDTYLTNLSGPFKSVSVHKKGEQEHKRMRSKA